MRFELLREEEIADYTTYVMTWFTDVDFQNMTFVPLQLGKKDA